MNSRGIFIHGPVVCFSVQRTAKKQNYNSDLCATTTKSDTKDHNPHGQKIKEYPHHYYVTMACLTALCTIISKIPNEGISFGTTVFMFQKFVESMPRCIEAALEACGGPPYVDFSHPYIYIQCLLYINSVHVNSNSNTPNTLTMSCICYSSSTLAGVRANKSMANLQDGGRGPGKGRVEQRRAGV